MKRCGGAGNGRPTDGGTLGTSCPRLEEIGKIGNPKSICVGIVVADRVFASSCDISRLPGRILVAKTSTDNARLRK